MYRHPPRQPASATSEPTASAPTASAPPDFNPVSPDVQFSPWPPGVTNTLPMRFTLPPLPPHGDLFAQYKQRIFTEYTRVKRALVGDQGFLHSTKVFLEMEGKYVQWLEELESLKAVRGQRQGEGQGQGQGQGREGDCDDDDVEKCIALMRWHLVLPLSPSLSLSLSLSRVFPSPLPSPFAFVPHARRCLHSLPYMTLTTPSELHPLLHRPPLPIDRTPPPPPTIHPISTPPLIYSAS